MHFSKIIMICSLNICLTTLATENTENKEEQKFLTIVKKLHNDETLKNFIKHKKKEKEKEERSKRFDESRKEGSIEYFTRFFNTCSQENGNNLRIGIENSKIKTWHEDQLGNKTKIIILQDICITHPTSFVKIFYQEDITEKEVKDLYDGALNDLNKEIEKITKQKEEELRSKAKQKEEELRSKANIAALFCCLPYFCIKIFKDASNDFYQIIEQQEKLLSGDKEDVDVSKE